MDSAKQHFTDEVFSRAIKEMGKRVGKLEKQIDQRYILKEIGRMDSAQPHITDDDFTEMVNEVEQTLDRQDPQKAAAMIDHKQKEIDKLFSCRTCQHYVRYQATKMQVRIPNLDLCCENVQQLRPLPPGGPGCDKHSMATQECYMGDPCEESKGSMENAKQVTIKTGEALLPVPKENMILVRVDKTEVVLKTAQGKEYTFDIADFDFDVADKRELPGKKPATWIGDDNCKKGDFVQIASKQLFKYITKSKDWLILIPQEGGGERTIPRKEYLMHRVCSPETVKNQRKKVIVGSPKPQNS